MKKWIHTGTYLFPLAIIGFGIINFINGRFSTAFMPVFPKGLLRSIPVYGCGALFIITGICIIAGKFTSTCYRLIAIFFFIDLIYPQLITLIQQPTNPNQWTVTLEVLALCSGACLAVQPGRIGAISKYTLAVSLIGFAFLHYKYADYIVTLIPAWLPAHYLLNALVFAGFLGTAVSLFFRMFTKLAAVCFGSMFLSWVLILHLPRCLSGMSKEAEWSSLCIAMAMAGIGFLLPEQEQ